VGRHSIQGPGQRGSIRFTHLFALYFRRKKTLYNSL